MIKYLQLPTCKLAEFISEATTEFTVSGFLYNDGVTPVDPSDIGDICFATLEPKTPREELISFTIDSVTAEGVATITAVRGLLQKSPYTAGGATFDHQNGSDLVISNNPGLFNQLTAKDNAEVITEQWTFPEPTADNSPATKAYADLIASLGGPEATDLVRGLVRLANSPQLVLGTATISIATPAVITLTGHGLVAGDSIKFTTTGALPTGLTAGNTYFVLATDLTANTFKISATLGGAAVNTSGSQSGVHTLSRWTPIISTFQPGMILMTGASSAPSGFVLCDGSAISRTTYTALFDAIGTTYGAGDGSTTFNVPNLKGKVPVGLDAAQTEFDALAETGGAKTHTLTTPEIPSHTHNYGGTVKVNTGGPDSGWSSSGSSYTNSTATQSAGGGGAHNNLQPYIVVNYIIKT